MVLFFRRVFKIKNENDFKMKKFKLKRNKKKKHLPFSFFKLYNI